MRRKWQMILALAAGAIFVLAIAVTVAYFRGRHDGAAKQEGEDRRERVDEAVERGDSEALDKEWER